MSTYSDSYAALVEFFADDPLTAYYTKYTTSYDDATSINTQVATELPCQAIQLDLTRNSNGLSSKFGTLIVQGDKELYLRPPEQTDPLATPLTIDTSSDRVRIGTTLYKVMDMKVLNPNAAQPLLYNLMLRL